MKQQNEKNKMISTFLVYLTIPLSGFAIDVYLPSFPNMTAELNTSVTNLQATLTFFLLSYGVSQFFIGTLVDSFGRYWIGLTALFLFAISCFTIVNVQNIYIIIFLRIVQGILIAAMMICQRSFLVDLHKNEPSKLKKYTSLVSIIWSTAPIIAPFLGGYIQYYFNWQANFYFLGIYALITLLLHLIFSGEALKTFKPFNLKSIKVMYLEMIAAKDFIYGVLLLGVIYTMVILFSMSIPFIVEEKYHFTSNTTGNIALLSGLSLFLGGMLSKYLLHKNFIKKFQISVALQVGVAVIMLVVGIYYESLISIIAFVVILHFLGGFLYNIYFTYCLTRFTAFAGLSSGFTSGGAYIVTSLLAFIISHIYTINNQTTMAIYYIVIGCLMTLILFLVLPTLKILNNGKRL